MTQILILKGIYTDSNADFRTAYPINLIPVAMEAGLGASTANNLSNGYLRQAYGIVEGGTHAYGSCRGLTVWNDTLYGVFGSNFVRINSDFTFTLLGNVGGGLTCRFTYGVDRLAINSGGRVYYYNGTTLTQLTDPDLGSIIDEVWVDSYFMFTDGLYLIVSDLNDPMSINPLKYGSSEADPDPILRLIKIRNEISAVNRYTIEVFDNVGGDNFPFNRIEGAQIQKGALGANCVCYFKESIAFIGSGKNETPSIYLANNGQCQSIATEGINQILRSYPDTQLSDVQLEQKIDGNQEFLIVHLPTKTLVFDAYASKVFGVLTWHILQSGLDETGKYLANNFTYVYDKWICTHKLEQKIGYLVNNISTQWGADCRWEFSTGITYNASLGVIFHELELLCLTGRVANNINPVIFTSYSNDGLNWSMDKQAFVGKIGDSIKKVSWLQQGYMKRWRIQKFKGNSDAFISVARLEARLEALNV